MSSLFRTYGAWLKKWAWFYKHSVPTALWTHHAFGN